MPSTARSRQSPPAYPPSLIVYAKLSGSKTVLLRLLIDTGATYTMIPVKAALAIGCDPSLAARRIPLVTVSAVEYTPLVTIPSLSCLGHHARNIDVACHDLPPQSAVDGLLGLNVLVHLPLFARFLDSVRSYLIQA